MGPEIAIAGWFAASLISRVMNFTIDHFVKGKSAKRKLEKLQQNLNKIRTIAELDRKQIGSQSLEDWLWRFKDAVCDAEDVIDGFEYQFAKDKKQVSSSASSSSRKNKKPNILRTALHEVLPASRKIKKPTNFIRKIIPARLKFDNDDLKLLDEVVKTFDDLAHQVGDLLQAVDQHRASGGLEQQEIPSWRLTTSPNKSRPIRGRAVEGDAILQALLETGNESICNRDKFFLVSIVGPGGIGKTDLARLAYNNPYVKDHFDMRAWVCVCNNFNVKRLTIEIIESSSMERPCDLHSIQSLEEIQHILANQMKDKRFLIVLDDVWEESYISWENLCAPFNAGKEGSRIIVTTRLESVAKMIGGEIKHLDGLEHGAYWELFKECAFGDQNHTERRQVGRQIAQKLGGSPLAAVTIGCDLKSDSKEEHWIRISRNKLGVIKRKEGDIVSVLELSYDQLPARLKQCYLSCALFPKNYCFEKDQLLEIWMALGFDHSDKRIDNGNLVDELSSRSFFVNEERKNDKFIIHAVLHELAEYICDGEFFRIEGEIEESREIKIPPKSRHVFVTSDNLVKVSKTLCKKQNLRSLVVGGSLSSDALESDFMTCLEDIFKYLKRLRLLILCELPGELPEAIGGLRHLRYLEFPGNEIKKLPKSLYNLRHLKWPYLKKGSERLRLPKCMKKLIKRHPVNAETEAISPPSSPEGPEVQSPVTPAKMDTSQPSDSRRVRRRLSRSDED